MKIFRAMLLVAAVVLSAGAPSRAQNLSLIWSEWETSAVEKQGPELADGILLYFHRSSSSSGDAAKDPIPGIFVEMAKVANWDILRINRHPFVDGEVSDGDVLQVVADRVARARQQGYRKVVLGGGERGGWLALSAATLPGVDAAIGFAPGRAFGRTQLTLARDMLAGRLARIGATRIAVFFFEGDPLEQLEERRSIAMRRGLEQSSASFMIVDHPPGLHGQNAMWSGRLARRYRDCLLRLVGEIGLPPGEVPCSLSTGYAVGSDIGLPASAGQPRLPDANPALLPYLGRWEGDDEWGAYLILEAAAIGANSIAFRAGWAEMVGSGRPTTTGGYTFQLNESDGAISYKPDGGPGILRARLLSTTELEVEFHIQDQNGQVTIRRLLLHKRTREAATP
jgi:hypothetical protein